MPSEFDEERIKRRTHDLHEKRAKSKVESQKFQELKAYYAEQGVTYTRRGAYRIANDNQKEVVEVFRIWRTPPQEIVQGILITNREGSKKATLPTWHECRHVLGDKSEAYIIGVAKPGTLEMISGFVSNDPNNPWGL